MYYFGFTPLERDFEAHPNKLFSPVWPSSNTSLSSPLALVKYFNFTDVCGDICFCPIKQNLYPYFHFLFCFNLSTDITFTCMLHINNWCDGVVGYLERITVFHFRLVRLQRSERFSHQQVIRFRYQDWE